jgi:hypothetical protein
MARSLSRYQPLLPDAGTGCPGEIGNGTNRKRRRAAWQIGAKLSCRFLQRPACGCHFRLPAGQEANEEFQRVVLVGARGFELPIRALKTTD